MYKFLFFLIYTLEKPRKTPGLESMIVGMAGNHVKIVFLKHWYWQEKRKNIKNGKTGLKKMDAEFPSAQLSSQLISRIYYIVEI